MLGLQCHTALYSWKVVFESDNHLFEMIFSACTSTEEEQWKAAIIEQSVLISPDGAAPREACPEIFTSVFLDLRPAGHIFGYAATLARRLSVQRAATVGTRNNPCQVIIRNTHRPHDSWEGRPGTSSINRSQSHLTTHRTVVLAPKRSDRIRLEQSLADVYSRDVLPYPGMTGHRSGLIRASAGSLVRKLSLASMHTPFARRSTSWTSAANKESFEIALNQSEDPNGVESDPATLKVEDESEEDELEALREEFGSTAPISNSTRKLSLTGVRSLVRSGTRSRNRRYSKAFLSDDPNAAPIDSHLVEERLDGRKRWSNPLGFLKNVSSEGVRHLLYSSKTP